MTKELLQQALNEAKAKEAADKAKAALQQDDTAENAIRKSVDDSPHKTIGSWHPISVTHNGVTQQFLFNIKRIISDGKGPQVIHLKQIKEGRIISSDDKRPLVHFYKLDRSNSFDEEGIPRYADDRDLKQWSDAFNAGLTAPTPAEVIAQQEQPTQEASATWTEMVVANLVREGVNKHRARELAAHFLTLFAPHTQPALTQEQPASVDAYVGAREDAAIWKKRALEAEELNRKFIAEVNGPTYLGEPVKQEQPTQGKCKCGHVGTSITVVESFPAHSVSVDEEDPDYKEHYYGLDVDATLQIGLEICRNCKTINGFWIEDTGGAEFYADWGKPRYTHPAPTQPALSEAEVLEIARKWSNRRFAESSQRFLVDFARELIEAHCRGGVDK